MDVFNFIAGLSSVVGLVITVRVWWSVRTIAEGYSRQALLPQFQRRLRGFTKNLKIHEQGKNAAEIRKALVLCRGTLQDLVPHLGRHGKNRALHVMGAIEQVLSLEDNSALWGQSGVIIAEREGLNNTLVVLTNEMKWRVPNA